MQNVHINANVIAKMRTIVEQGTVIVNLPRELPQFDETTRADLYDQLAQPWMKFGTDAGGADPARSGALTHPRAYGTFPRILGKYVREERIMPLEEAIRKMTSAVADRLSIRDRGLLREGYFADVVLFNPATVGDVATYEQPHQVSLGVRWVLVNGTVVVREGEHTGALPGRIVRGPGYVPQ